MDAMIPANVQLTIELVKYLGTGAVIFVIWLITIKFFSEILKRIETLFNSLIEKQEKSFSESLNKQESLFTVSLQEQAKRNDQNFQVLNKFAESIDYMAGQVSTVQTKIDSNQFCPIVRDQAKAS